ncbi:MAG: GIY-YIG nuclease family protein [Candidatus Levybacteria bacterium]|nr:GIY-YIG nuclease family protein [Candidatus Levybacteria bacterium]
MVIVYILQSLRDKGFYIGITKNVEERLVKHNRGEVQSTKKRRPFKIIYTEQFNNYDEARKRESEIKSYKGGNSFRKLLT